MVIEEHPILNSYLNEGIKLSEFLKTIGQLTLADRKLIVKQAKLIFEGIFVHLHQKQAKHIADPVQRLNLLGQSLMQTDAARMPPELDFHKEMLEIFISVRDLHTTYSLPEPFNNKVACLPFMVEAYYEGSERLYLVSHTIVGLRHPTFVPGVEIIYWNAIPIAQAVTLNAERTAGSNYDAKLARGVDSLTIRPLATNLPPDEEWVILTYRTEEGELLELSFDWLVLEENAKQTLFKDDGGLGIDLRTELIQGIKKTLFVPEVSTGKLMNSQNGTLSSQETSVESAEIDFNSITDKRSIIEHRVVHTSNGIFSYIRIYNFKNSSDYFVDEFLKLKRTRKLQNSGLIIDIRGNPGGEIHAGERLLQTLTPHQIEPENFQFLNTPLTLDLCRRYAHQTSNIISLPSKFDLSRWVPSITEAVQSGSVYSQVYPIVSEKLVNNVEQLYIGPVVLINDALSYSTSDIFSAGFQDNKIGSIIGVDGSTGAGGANVWWHDYLTLYFSNSTSESTSPFRSLPKKARMSVAIRRSLRVGDRSGTVVEGFGIIPDYRHFITRRDLLEKNTDLIEAAGKILAQKKVYDLQRLSARLDDTVVVIRVVTKGLTRLDFFLKGRPQHSADVENGLAKITFPSRDGMGRKLEVLGYDGENLVARTTAKIKPLRRRT